ncbi:hypothetical protein BCR34DRAFT_593470 [Clohesyomyces aquaticus]|uniref:Methyltransferase n=1 Tax=Clohesyomyces aquaticus TaxID=1231657 RepID=A0A1Y1YIF8_9PLEO|nr:hypothetical protein BCR34DRAFT_593470 [Clohesyomyces aquaticus]
MATYTLTQRVDALPLHSETIERHPPRDVQTSLNYYRDPGDGSSPMPVLVGGDTVTNERPTQPVPVVVHDVSVEVEKYKVDSHGFEYVRHASQEKKFEDEAVIKSEYYRECEELYKRVTGAPNVRIFAHQVRCGPTHWHSLGHGNAQNKGPLNRVHVDQSYHGAEIMFRKHAPSAADALLQQHRRWQIINLWRPISTIYKDPLAVAAAYSIAEEDLVAAPLIYTKQPPPLNKTETWTILPGEGHEWYYKNEQRSDEVLLIKCFDSEKREGLARRAPHCAFKDPEREGEGWADRQSIEVRALLWWDE